MPLGDDLCVCLPADTEDVCIVERLFSSSLVAIVSLKAPRKLKVCHFKKGTEICNYSYSNTILAVKLNRQVGGQGQREKKQTKKKNLLSSYTATRDPGGTGVCQALTAMVLSCTSSAEIDRVSGGIALHSQHPRHESAAHYQRDSTQPFR